MKASEILTEARDLLKNKGWNKRALARTHDGSSCMPHVPDAVSYCSIGAIGKIHYNLSYLERYAYGSVYGYIQQAAGTRKLAAWNDKWYRMKWQVIRAFNKAIALAEKDGN